MAVTVSHRSPGRAYKAEHHHITISCKGVASPKMMLLLMLLLLPNFNCSLSVSSSLRYRQAVVSSQQQQQQQEQQQSPFHHHQLLQSPITSCHHSIHYLRGPLYSSAASIDDSANDTIECIPHSLAMGVGVVASLVGYLYSKCMKVGFKFLWKILPSKVLINLNLFRKYPTAYIPTIITLGGLLVAILSTLFFPHLFTAHDYVHLLSTNDNYDSSSGADMNKFPSARKHLLPVMLLCCLTSISGFSLGPEAPMVTAGGLVGVSLARKYCKWMNIQSSTKLTSDIEQTLAYAGAAGTLTGFMNIPLAGPIFALEMTSRTAGILPFAAKSWSAAIAASLAGMVIIRGCFTSTMTMGGHFLYGPRGTAITGSLRGQEAIVASLLCGIGGAVAGTLFHKCIIFFKSILWQTKNTRKLTPPATVTATRMNEKKFLTVAKKTLVASLIGLLSIYFPQTMFWGDGSLQCMIDGQYTPFSVTPHGLPLAMTALAIVNPNQPLTSGYAALQVGLAKFLAIALASAGKFPGGVIFPLLSCGAMLSHAFVAVVYPLLLHLSIITTATSSLVVPMMTMSFMAATLTSITRTPLSTVLILALTASSMTSLSVLLPGVFLASYLSVWVSELLSSNSFFSYSSELK